MIFFVFLAVFSPLHKYEASTNFDLKFEDNYKIMKIYLPDAVVNVYESEKGIKVFGEIKIYHRDKEKAKDFLKNVKIDSEENEDVLKIFVSYSNDKKGREARKLSKLFVLNVYAQKNLPLGIYLKSGGINFKDKQERNLVVEGRDLRVDGNLSKNYKKIEAFNYFGDLNISGENLIKRYLFPFGKKVIYLNPEGVKEGFFKVIKGKVNIKIGD